MTNYTGGIYPTYPNVDQIDASGVKFILVQMEGGEHTATYEALKYTLQLKASSQTELDTARNTLHKLSSDTYSSSTKYSRNTSTFNTSFTASNSVFVKITDGEGGAYHFTEITPQLAYGLFTYIEGESALYNIISRFDLSAYTANIINTLSITITAQADITIAVADTGLGTIVAPHSDFDYDGDELDPAVDIYYLDGDLTDVTAESTETITFAEIGGITYDDINTVFQALTDPSHFDISLVTQNTDADAAIYGVSAGKAPILVVNFKFGDDYPFWLTINLQNTFISNNQFYATFDVEARWAL